MSVRLNIPAEFFADVVFDADGKPRIERFVVSPLESYAGFFGSAEVNMFSEDEPEEQQQAALEYWKACNDGTWPLDRVDWEE